ncbi:MAG TPA: carboxymuconolactone decarboxylase family protein [Stellaceae bacterium]
MTALLNYAKAAPESYQAMLKFSNAAHQVALEPALLELVRVRASQLNHCAFCLDMHTIDARAAGETEQRLYAVAAWEEAPFFTPRERAALAWTEAVTRLTDGPVPEALYHETREHFGEKEIVDLTLAIIAINGWNRLAGVFRTEAGHYKARVHATTA